MAVWPPLDSDDWDVPLRAYIDSLDATVVNGQLTFTRADGTVIGPFPVQGPVGPPVNIGIGTVSTGTPAASTNNTDPANPLLNLTFPAASWSSTALGTTDLNTVTTPGLYGQANGADATTARNYPVLTPPSRVVLKVTQTNASTILQELTPVINLEPRVTYARRLFNGAWSTWRSFLSQRIAQTSGQPAPELFVWDDVANVERQVEVSNTSLGTADLNAVTVSGTYVQTNLTNATLAKNYPAVGIGVLEVFGSGNTTTEQRYTPTRNWGGSGRGFFMRRWQVDGTWETWKFFPSQRVDQTAGRAIYTWDDLNSREQLIYGDTGWRDVTASLINGWTAELVAVRRQNYEVWLAIRNLNFTTATSDSFLQVAGFPGGISGLGNTFIAPLINGQGISWGSGGTFSTSRTGSIISGNITQIIRIPAGGAWPIALPGTAIGAIPNT